MKKIILSAVAVMSITGAVQAAQTITDSLKTGKFTVDSRVFYFDRSFSDQHLTGTSKNNATALTAGGIMKYVSDDYKGLQAGIAYYGSHSLGFYSREEGVGTSILERNTGEDLAFLGEAYLEYSIGKTIFKFGRQRLSTPLMNDHDLRLLPSAYEAYIVKNTNLPDTTIEAGFVRRYTGFTSKDNNFLDNKSNWGDDGLAYIYLTNKSIENLSLTAQYIGTISDTYTDAGLTNDISVADYRYADFAYNLVAVGTNTYLKAQYGGNDYKTGNNSMMYGTKIGTTIGMFDLALLYNKISDNNFKAVESGPMYSDWQQGYSNYGPSTAFGGQVTIKPITGLSIKLGYVDVSADENEVKDDFSEFNLDANYAINDISKLRVRYSIKNESSAAEETAVAGTYPYVDQNDFRIIYYLSF